VEKGMTAFDRAWPLVKMPYYIRPDELMDTTMDGPHEVLYQGGKEGDPDSSFWTPDKSVAMLYAILGSDMFSEEPREGRPQLRMARPTEDDVILNPDLGHKGAAVAGDMDYEDLRTLTNEYELDSEIIPFPGLDSEDLREMWNRLEDPWSGSDSHGNKGISLAMFGGGLDNQAQERALDDWWYGG
jgi:hypothetical protein